MPRPDIRVQYFIGCLNAPWEGVPGPNTPRTLEGVALYYGVPPDAEPWFEYRSSGCIRVYFEFQVGTGVDPFP